MNNSKKVEYKLVKVKDTGWFNTKIDLSQMEDALNHLGQQGWDLATSLNIDYKNGSGTKEVILLLKRYSDK